MCGITGVISRAPLSSVRIEQVRGLNRHQFHRGPDGEGFYSATHVMLAMRRLSIIDLETGWQPLYNEDSSLVLIANGEVYNHVELRSALRARGHTFATGSDCETILHAYEEYGPRFVDHLRGMYAFALWDSRRRRLLLGRDRMGEKPLYLAHLGDSLVFSSELRPLVQAGIVPLCLDPAAVKLYYHYGFVPEPHCIVSNIRKLPAAHLLTIDLERWSFNESRYWSMEDAPPLDGDPGRLIRAELERTAELVTRADVPVGVALSGGLDASSIAALASRARKGDLHAFTVGYAGSPWQDERSNAREFAEHLGIPFHSVELSTSDFIEQYSVVNLNRDDPIADIAGVSIAAVARLARHHRVPVLLFGHGGDELFWGYEWLRNALFATRRRHSGSTGVHQLVQYLHMAPPPLSMTMGIRWALSCGGLLDEMRQYRIDRRAEPNSVVFYDNEPFFRSVVKRLRHGFFTEQFAALVGAADPSASFVARNPDTPPEITLIRLICETYLAENGIAQGDRLSMAASIESRLPLVDYRLVETVVGLHKTHTIRREDRPKQWLRDAMQDTLPDSVLNRRKTGFSPPWRAWSRALALTHGEQLIDGYLVGHGVICAEAAQSLRRDLFPRIAGPRPLALLTLSLENWCRQMDKAAHARSEASMTVPVFLEPNRTEPHPLPVAAAVAWIGPSAAHPGDHPGTLSPGTPEVHTHSIGTQAVRGTIWMVGASGAAKTMGFACQLALAWFLSRRDFGVYAIAISLAVLLSIFRDGGIPIVLEQKGRRFDRFAGSAFWMMLSINAATGLLIAGIAAPAARFYGLPELKHVILWFAATLPMCVFPALLTLKLNLGMRFRALGLIQVVSSFIRNLALLYFAASGFGAISFVLPTLITCVTDTALLFAVCRYAPWTLPPRFADWPELFQSGRWVLLGTFAIAMGNSGVYFVLGKLVSSDVLGTYFFAYQLVIQLGVLLADNVYQVLFASFVRIGGDLQRIRAATPRALIVVLLTASMLSLVIAAVYPPLQSILWRDKWAATVPAVDIFALVWPWLGCVSVFRALQAATGHFRQWGLVTLLGGCTSIAGTAIAGALGHSAGAAAAGFAAGTLLGVAMNAALALSNVHVPWRPLILPMLRPWLVLASAATVARLIGSMLLSPWLQLLAELACFSLLGFIGLALLANDSLALAFEWARKLTRGRFSGASAGLVRIA